METKSTVKLDGRLELQPGTTVAEIEHALSLIGATFTPAPKHGARVKAPVKPLHRADFWPPRAS